MKTIAHLTALVAVAAFSFGIAQADNAIGARNNPAVPGQVASDVTGFKSQNTLGPTGVNESSKFPNVHPDLRPRLGGIFYDGGSKYGAQLINPAAPASYGYGQKYLSAPSAASDLQNESGPSAHRDAGGFKLLSWEF
jgi:hypothetical protein